MTPALLSLLLMVVTILVGVLGIIYFHRRGNDGLYLRQLILLDFIVTYPVSGIVHVWPLSTGADRGFYDALTGYPAGARAGLVPAAVACLVAEIVLLMAMAWSYRTPRRAPRSEPVYSWPVRQRIIALVVVVLLGAVSGASLLRVMTHAASMNSERVVDVPPGEARYVFLASWFPWVVTLGALLVAARRRTPGGSIWNLFVLTAAVGGVFFSFAWSGGRAETMVYGIPIIALLAWRLGPLRLPYAIVGAVAGSAFIAAKTMARTKSFDVWGILDWQWGRFSMVAWADDYGHTHGFLHGETLANGYLNVPWAIAHLLGAAPSMDGVRSVVNVTGEYFVGDPAKTYIVPGMVTELYLNFGMWGVVAGHVVLGVIVGLVADWYRNSDGEMAKVLAAYVGSVLLFETINAQSGAFLAYVLQSGLPLFAFWFLEMWARRGQERTPHLADRPLRAPTTFNRS